MSGADREAETDMAALRVAVAIVIVLAVALLVPLGDNPRSGAWAADIVRHRVVIDKRKVTDEKELHVSQGDTVELEVVCDEPAELHLHGYDKVLTVAPGKPATLNLEARIAGRFPLEAHSFGAEHAHSNLVLFYLEVDPR